MRPRHPLQKSDAIVNDHEFSVVFKNRKLCRVKYINAQSVCELLQKIGSLNLETPITLVLDNARYQKCELVRTVANNLKIELLFLPTYSPNLNLIERLWKFVKKNCLYSKYYSDFVSFKTAIENCLSQTHTQHKKSLDSLLSLNFQTFVKEQFVTA